MSYSRDEKFFLEQVIYFYKENIAFFMLPFVMKEEFEEVVKESGTMQAFNKMFLDAFYEASSELPSTIYNSEKSQENVLRFRKKYEMAVRGLAADDTRAFYELFSPDQDGEEREFWRSIFEFILQEENRELLVKEVKSAAVVLEAVKTRLPEQNKGWDEFKEFAKSRNQKSLEAYVNILITKVTSHGLPPLKEEEEKVLLDKLMSVDKNIVFPDLYQKKIDRIGDNYLRGELVVAENEKYLNKYLSELLQKILAYGVSLTRKETNELVNEKLKKLDKMMPPQLYQKAMGETVAQYMSKIVDEVNKAKAEDANTNGGTSMRKIGGL